jgi:hypothetical protein
MPPQHHSPQVQTVALPTAGRWLSVVARVVAGLVMLGALAAVFVPEHPDPLVVISFAGPSLALAMLSHHLDGRTLLTGDPRTGPSTPAPAPAAGERATAGGGRLLG